MFVSANNLNFHVDIRGPAGAPVLVLLHSLGTNLHLWDPQAEILSNSYCVIRLDLRGHGLSEAPGGAYTMHGLAEDVVAVLDELGIDGFAVGGVSIGGMIAQAIAAHVRSRVEALLLVDTSLVTASPDAWRQRAEAVRQNGVGPLVDGIVSRWVTPAFLMSPEVAGLRTMLLRTPSDGFAGCAEAIANADLTDAAVTGIPTLVVVGDKDVSTPIAMAETLAASFGAQLKILSPAAHIPNLELPNQLADMMLLFLSAQGLTHANGSEGDRNHDAA